MTPEIGRALLSTIDALEALPWFERAVEAAQKGDVHGRVDQQSLDLSLRALTGCRAALGRQP